MMPSNETYPDNSTSSTNPKMQDWEPCQTACISTWVVRLFGLCFGQRKPTPTTTPEITADSKCYDTDAESLKEDEDWAPLLEEKTQRVPRHAASSFLKTSTSKLIREANNIL